jgi:hypothetical protein
MNQPWVLAIIAALAVILGPIVAEAVRSFRERRDVRTSTREVEAEEAMTALREALDAKDDLIEDLREDRNRWRELHLSSQDGWYGQRRRP